MSPLPAPNALAGHFSGLHVMGSSGSDSQRTMGRSFRKMQKAQGSDQVRKGPEEEERGQEAQGPCHKRGPRECHAEGMKTETGKGLFYKSPVCI